MRAASQSSIGNLKAADGPFGRACRRLLEQAIDGYMRSLVWALRHPLADARADRRRRGRHDRGMLFGVVPKGALPTQDTGVIRGDHRRAVRDISFAAMSDRQRAVVSVIEQDPAVESIDLQHRQRHGGGFQAGSTTAASASIWSIGEPAASRPSRRSSNASGQSSKRSTASRPSSSPVQDFGFGGPRQGKCALPVYAPCQ